MEQAGFAQRVWEAYKELEKREGKVSQADLARRIEERGGHPTRQDDVSRWFREVSRPEFEELPAIAEVLGVDLMWLTFGLGVAARQNDARPPARRERTVRNSTQELKTSGRRK